MAAANAVLTCRFCLGIHIPHALGVGVSHVLIILHVRYVMVGRWINDNIIVVNALMLSAVNHLPTMLTIPLMQLPTPHCPRPPRGSVSPSPPSLPFPPPSEGLGEGSEAPSVTNINAVNVDEPRVPSPTSMPSREYGERGKDTPWVDDGEASRASAGGSRHPTSRSPRWSELAGFCFARAAE